MEKHCTLAGNVLYTFDMEDTVGKDRQGLSMQEKVIVAGTQEKKMAHLPNRMLIAISMKVMVTWNTSTDADLANRARSKIVDILLDPRKDASCALTYGSARVSLKFPLAMILFKPANKTTIKFPGLANGLKPLFQTESTFSIVLPNGTRSVIMRQMALTASYSFMDYRSQGQTIEYVIVDLGKVPTGCLSPFSAYVVLLRSRSHDTIQLLRDFNKKLFTTHLPNKLRTDNERLERPAKVTSDMYKAGFYRSWNLYIKLNNFDLCTLTITSGKW